MEIDLATPALLFPAISLLMLAYTNRFVALANIIRGLRNHYLETRDPLIYDQIQNLKYRVVLIRNMQWFGAVSLLLCVLAMGFKFAEWHWTASFLFSVSLFSMAISLLLSIWEIQKSVGALELNLRDMEELARSSEKHPNAKAPRSRSNADSEPPQSF